ncbi:hypothetical protein BDC45DRAFT_510202 [Circinella umbellata]|nr:hypothetical protein BDC45DRAFT_510202 [Circinella umbellata]
MMMFSFTFICTINNKSTNNSNFNKSKAWLILKRRKLLMLVKRSNNNNNSVQEQLQDHQLKETYQTLQQRQQSDRHCFWVIRTCADHDSICLTDQPLSSQQIEQLRIKITNEIKFTKKEYSIDDLKLANLSQSHMNKWMRSRLTGSLIRDE